MLIGGHRGFSEKYPHNSWEGFSAALSQSDFFELDVRRTSDGVRVLSHDPNIGTVDLIREPWSEVCQLDLGGGVHPITLDELIGRIGDIPLDIELKNVPWQPDFDPSMEHPVAAAALARPQDMVTSFSWETMAAVRSALPSVKTGLIFRDPVTMEEAVKAAVAGHHNVVAPHHTLVNAPDEVAAAHRVGLEVVVWTVNQAEDVQRMGEFGVDALITDNPGKIRREMAR
jgi:glycerophosphoryl diester phosphodiesterase